VHITGGPTRSDWEDEFPAFCKQYDLPEPVLSTSVAGYEADALFPNEKIVIELDSWEFHQDRESFESDRDRDADRLAAGYWTVRITWPRIKLRSEREATRLHKILRRRREHAR
jgi:very-short-patch-repair endonuclease